MEITRSYQLGPFSTWPLADHLFLGSQAHTHSFHMPSQLLKVLGWEGGRNRGRELKKMKTRDIQDLLLTNYVTLVEKSTFLSPNFLICKRGLKPSGPRVDVRITPKYSAERKNC